MTETNRVAERLISWYREHKREMPWRNTSDPYHIWLSEIILQQTRVNQGLPYYQRFLEKYPTINQLAEADIDDVLRLWQGLGYYSRARNLHKCATIIVQKHKGNFPTEGKDLRKLPGVGPYTSAAIASFAFGKKEAVVDGNVMRVIARLYGISEDISENRTFKVISEIVNGLIPDDVPDIFNHALMEFGAIHCTPTNPDCNSCIFKETCVANAKMLQDQIPLKGKKIKKKTRYFHYLIIKIGDRFLMRKRMNKDIWQGLFEFYLLESAQIKDFDHLPLPEIFARNPRQWKLMSESQSIKHALTHQNIICRFFHIELEDSFTFDPSIWHNHKLYSLNEIENLPKPILLDKYLGDKII
jgi:A/G-specific adenine glycosylase